MRWAGIPGSASAFYRVLVAGVVLLPWRLARGSTRPVERRAVFIAVIGGIFFGLDLAFWNTSVMYTGAAVASILGHNTPVFVAILSWLLLHRRPKLAFWIGLSLSVAGCLTIMLGPVSAGATPVTKTTVAYAYPLGVYDPSSFTHNVMPENRTSEATLKAMTRTGRWREDAACKSGK